MRPFLILSFLFIAVFGTKAQTVKRLYIANDDHTDYMWTANEAQYDHGTKETALNSIVIQILAKGKSYERTLKLGDTIRAAGAAVLTVEEPEVEEHFSILNNIIPFNFMAYYLAEKMGISETFAVGGKITEVVGA